MTNVYDVKASELVSEAAKKLKDVLKAPPDYIHYVKSGASKERPPQDPEFWYVRSASILRQVYVNGPVGISRLRVRYGSRKEHEVHRRHHWDSGGSIIQDSLNALEAVNFVKKTKKGREITSKGKSFLDGISKEISGAPKAPVESG